MDRLIEDSKCVVNIGANHPVVKNTNEGRIIESLRLAYCVNNGVLVVSEQGGCEKENEFWDKYCDVVSLEDIEETISEAIYEDKYIQKRFKYAERYQKETSMKDNMKELIKTVHPQN